MGASEFTNVGIGITPEVAFDWLRDEAAWEYGHGGYTGTIAEKSDFILFGTIEPKEGETVRDLIYALYKAQSEFQRGCEWDEAKRDWVERPSALDLSTVPETIRRFVTKQVFEQADDKWGAACCLEVVGPAAERIVARNTERGYTGNRVFVFFGIASD